MSKSEKVEKEVVTVVVIEPKVFLDEEIKHEVNRHYHARLNDSVLGRECFSDPKMESHVCNPLAKLDGGVKCTRCGHKVGRPCEITCDVHHYCLAVYALRLGISTKAKKRSKKIKDNLGRPYKDLHKEVMERHLLRAADTVEDAVAEETTTEGAAVSEAEVAVPNEEDLITTGQAAKLYECSHAKMLGLVKTGKLEKVVQGRATYLRRKDVEDYKSSALSK